MPRFHNFLLIGLVFCLLAACQPAAASSPTPLVVSEQSVSTHIAELPTFTPSPAASATVQPSLTPTLDCASQPVTVETAQITTPLLAKPLQVRVYLPACATGGFVQKGKTYPLLILLHGQSSDLTQWDRLELANQLNQLAAGMVVVTPYEEYSLADPYESNFGKALAVALVPWAENHYALCQKRACRALGGVSRGASWAVLQGLTDWQTFGLIGAHSLSTFYGFNLKIPRLFKEIPNGQAPLIYMDSGQRDRYINRAREFDQMLTGLKLPHTWILNSGEHDEVYWKTHLGEYLKWYSKNLLGGLD
jgi:enterochelin esterase-like enzyme